MPASVAIALAPLHAYPHGDPTLKVMGLYGDPRAVFVHPRLLVRLGISCTRHALMEAPGNISAVPVEVYVSDAVDAGTVLASPWVVDHFLHHHEGLVLVAPANPTVGASRVCLTLREARGQALPTHSAAILTSSMKKQLRRGELPLRPSSLVACRHKTELHVFELLVQDDRCKSEADTLFHVSAETTFVDCEASDSCVMTEAETAPISPASTRSYELVMKVDVLLETYSTMLNFMKKYEHASNMVASFALPPILLMTGCEGSGKTCLCNALVEGSHGMQVFFVNAFDAFVGDTHEAQEPSKNLNQSDPTEHPLLQKVRAFLSSSRDKGILSSNKLFIIDDVHMLYRSISRHDSFANARLVMERVMDIIRRTFSQSKTFLLLTTTNKRYVPSALLSPEGMGFSFTIPELDQAGRNSALSFFLADEVLAPGPTGEGLALVVEQYTRGFLLRDLVGVISKCKVQRIPLVAAAQAYKPLRLQSVHTHDAVVTFADVGGYAAVKSRLLHMVKLRQNQTSGGATTSIPLGMNKASGVLLHGPSGCGKTMLVEAVATESRCPFVLVRAPDLLSPYLGESERKLRELFASVQSAETSVVFLDEVDAIIPARTDYASSGAGGVGERLLSTLLNEIDGISTKGGSFIIGATSRLDAVDPALRRPGRLGALIEIHHPSGSDRVDIADLYSRKFNIDLDGIDWAQPHFDGSTGADIKKAYEEAAMDRIRESIKGDLGE